MSDQDNKQLINYEHEIQKYNESVSDWQKQCTEIEQQREKVISERISKKKAELIDTANQNLSDLLSLQAQLDKELRDANTQLSTCSTFDFAKKKDLNAAISGIESRIKALNPEIIKLKAAIKDYQENASNAAMIENRKIISEVVTIQNPIPEKPQFPNELVNNLCTEAFKQLKFLEVYALDELKTNIPQIQNLSDDVVRTLADKMVGSDYLVSCDLLNLTYYSLSTGNTEETKNSYITKELLYDYLIAHQIISLLNDMNPHSLSEIQGQLAEAGIININLPETLERLCEKTNVSRLKRNSNDYYFLSKSSSGLNSKAWIKPIASYIEKSKQQGEKPTTKELEDERIKGYLLKQLENMRLYTAAQLIAEVHTNSEWEELPESRIMEIVMQLVTDEILFKDNKNGTTVFFLYDYLSQQLITHHSKKSTASRTPTAMQLENEKIKDYLVNNMVKHKQYTAEQILSEILGDTTWYDISESRLNALLAQLVEDNSLMRDYMKRKAYYSVL